MDQQVHIYDVVNQEKRQAMFSSAMRLAMQFEDVGAITTPYFWECDCVGGVEQWIRPITVRDCKVCGRQANDAQDAVCVEVFDCAARGKVDGQGDNWRDTDDLLDAAYERFMTFDLRRKGG